MALDRDFKKANKLIIDASESIIKATAIKLFSAIVDDTPVDTGRLRGNWQTTLGSPTQITLTTLDKTGRIAKTQITNITNKLKINGGVFLTNNLPYADVIENGNSRIRGHFMVQRAVVSFSTELNKQAKRSRK